MSDGEIQRRPGGRAVRVRQAVLDAALEALIEGGTIKFSFADVAKRAGVNETSIYRRWRTRENLLTDTLLAASDRRIPVPDTGSVREDLRIFATLVTDYLNSPLGAVFARVAVIPVEDPEMAEAREMFWRSRIELAAVMIERGVTRGELRAGIDPRVALEALIAPLHSRVLLLQEPLGEELPRVLADLVLDGLGARDNDTAPKT
ncbi:MULTISPECIES: TetR/AcrR family transcriptional regulator [Streptosporangium]|uniref:AcrR family transcriptional regulator n=1 Tax=Streptosporangium brasiliense TaxID=47480 RepID=A0ABT9RIB9_9ACTN|nr:TetR/AcrR family transcriptional regulator [Streptosporangium brasiliense]MDP9869028.1 AcrR family transcriptional regulator [Streptosporangium brasiliense]